MFGTTGVQITGMLPGGYWDSEGTLHREFELAVLTGRDEELLAQTGRWESASLVSTILSRSVRRVGNLSPLTEGMARKLLVADRQYLLLKLRQFTLGNVVKADLFCPWEGCGQRVHVEFGIDQVPVEEAAEPAAVYSMFLSPGAAGVDGPRQREVRFRLPNGSDQEACGPWLAENEAKAFSLLLARTIQGIGEDSPVSTASVEALSPLARAEIEAEMERVAPRIEQTIEAVCSECGRSFDVPFDVQRFFFGEMRTDIDLYRQVHYLAYHYHWSETEILAMPRNKRQHYIDLLADEIEALNHGD